MKSIKLVESVEALKKAEFNLNHRKHDGKALSSPKGIMLEGLMSTTFYAYKKQDGKKVKVPSKSFKLKSKILLNFENVGLTMLYLLAADNGLKVKIQTILRSLSLEKAIEDYGAVKLDNEEETPEISYLIINVKQLISEKKSGNGLEKAIKELRKAIKQLDGLGMDSEDLRVKLRKLEKANEEIENELEEEKDNEEED